MKPARPTTLLDEKIRSFPKTLVLLALAAAGASFGYGQAASSTGENEQAVQLPQFNVSEAGVDPYNSSDASTALRTAGKILDTPLTIYVITPALIEDINPPTLFDVANYFPGVSPGRATGTGGFNDRMTFRGIESFSTTRDNFAAVMLPYGYEPFDNFDPVFMDHAELIMGPDAILAPTGQPGGTLSAVTKSPEFTPKTEISGIWGNYDANRYTFDSTGPIPWGSGPPKMAYRIMGAWQDTYTYKPGNLKAQAEGIEFTYKFSENAKLTFKYFHTDQFEGGTVGLSDLEGIEVSTPNSLNGATLPNTPPPGFQYNGWNGDWTGSYRHLRDNVFQVESTSALGEHIAMRWGAQVYYSDDNENRGYPIPTLTEAWNPQSGQEISITAVNPAALPEDIIISHIESRQYQFQNDYAGNWNEGGVSLQPLLGWAYQNGSIPVFWSAQDKSVPAANLAQGFYGVPAPSSNAAYNVSPSNTPENGWTMEAYGFMRAGFLHDRLFATFGGGRTWANVNDYTIPFVNQPAYGVVVGNTNAAITDATFSNTSNSLAPSVQPWHDTYIAGALAKVLPDLSVYYNFSTNAQLASAAPLWQAGRQNEFGAKATFFNNRLTVSADHFAISENNLSYQNPAYNLSQSTIPFIYTNLTSHGEEASVMGGITPDLSLILSYTNQQPRDFVGRRQRNLPDNMANALVDYHFKAFSLKKNADVFVGIIHQGDVAGENVAGFTALGVPELPGYYVAGYTVANAGAGITIDRYRFNLNIQNLTDEKFWWQAQSRQSLLPYQAITITLKMTIRLF